MFEQISGSPCLGVAQVCGQPLDGLTVLLVAPPLEDGRTCRDYWYLDCADPDNVCCDETGQIPVEIGRVDLELRCASSNRYELRNLAGSGAGDFYLFNPDTMDPADNRAALISGQAVPWQFVFEFAASEFALCGTETGVVPVFRVTLTEDSLP